MNTLISFLFLQAPVDKSTAEFFGVLISIALLFGSLFVIFFISRAIEKKHFDALDEGEETYRHILVTDIAYPLSDVDTTKVPQWVASEVAVSSSRIKDFFARWRSFFGGEIKSYQTLQERALREARLRLCQQAHVMGCDAICNLRFTAAQISLAALSSGRKRKREPIMVAMQASGTAYNRGNVYSPGSRN